jgi:16S rRNA (guanine527-N7)-methyltransferase
VTDRVTEALERSVSLGFLGPAELTAQIDHALGFVIAIEQAHGGIPATGLDLGSGGGLPGLLLGACWPSCRLTLLDAAERRTAFLKREAAKLPWLGHTEVARGRAEELGRDPRLRERFEVVTSRSFGPPAVTVECGSPFVIPGGVMVVSDPPDPDPDERWPDEGLSGLGLVKSGITRVEGRFRYQILRKIAGSSDRYPRRTGVPAKRPLF